MARNADCGRALMPGSCCRAGRHLKQRPVAAMSSSLTHSLGPAQQKHAQIHAQVEVTGNMSVIIHLRYGFYSNCHPGSSLVLVDEAQQHN
jgi:hypothetical protein